MASLKDQYLGVYASSTIIRAIFLPTCYLLLTSPFLLLLIRYFGADQKIKSLLPDDFRLFDILPQIFIGSVLLLLPTRLFSVPSSTSKDGGPRRVQQIPYWIPFLRNWPSVVFGGEQWLEKVRDTSVDNIAAYKSVGSLHNVIFSPHLLDQIAKNSENLEEAELTKWYISRNAFNMPSKVKSQYFELHPTIAKKIESELFKGNQLEKVVSASLKVLTESLPDLITFNSSVVDQMNWERVAGIDLTDGTSEAECDLFALLNEFFCSAILIPITGAQFPEQYQLLASDLATTNQLFYALALGLPRFTPVKGLPGAVLARKRLMQNFKKLFNEITNPPPKRVPEDDESMSGEETDAETPTPLTALNQLFTEYDLPIPARAAITLQLIHGLASEIVPLAFWTILHIYSQSTVEKEQGTTGTPLKNVREDTKAWAQAFQPPSIHPSFPAPPAISFSAATPALSAKQLPYLRSCINEAKRLYNASPLTLKVTKPITLKEAEDVRPGFQEQFILGVGSYVDVGLSETLINTSPANHFSPKEVKLDRFLHGTGVPPIALPTDHSGPYTTALLLSFVAGVTQLWEVAAAPKKSFFDQMHEIQAAAAGQDAPVQIGEKKVGTWVVPKAVDGAKVKIPKADVRVRIRRREGLEGPKPSKKKK